MVFALSEDERSARGRRRASHSLLPEALGESLRAMAREHSGLVHQPTSLVGTSNPGVVSKIENRKSKIQNRQERLYRPQAAARCSKLETRRRHPPHLVFIVDVGLRNDGPED